MQTAQGRNRRPRLQIKVLAHVTKGTEFVSGTIWMSYGIFSKQTMTPNTMNARAVTHATYPMGEPNWPPLSFGI